MKTPVEIRCPKCGRQFDMDMSDRSGARVICPVCGQDADHGVEPEDTPAGGLDNVCPDGPTCPDPECRAECREALDRILGLSHHHMDQYWLDAPGTDRERMDKIVNEARALIARLDAQD